MATNKPRLGKRVTDHILAHARGQFNLLYRRAISHVPFEASDEQLMHAMVREEDIPYVRRSKELFKPLDNYIYRYTLDAHDFPGTPKGLCVKFNDTLSWLPPHYLMGQTRTESLPLSFIPLFQPYVEQAMPFYEMHKISHEAWQELRVLCDSQLNRMLYLWPALGTLDLGHDLSLLPKPIGSPSLTPDLRRKLETATTFINTVKLMPESANHTGNVLVWLS